MTLLTALVVLRPASRRSLEEMPPITSDNLDEARVLPEDRRTAESYFADLGFAVDDAGPLAFAIAGSEELFEHTFGPARLRGDETRSYAIDALPEEIRERIEAVESERYESFSA